MTIVIFTVFLVTATADIAGMMTRYSRTGKIDWPLMFHLILVAAMLFYFTFLRG